MKFKIYMGMENKTMALIPVHPTWRQFVHNMMDL